MLQIVTPLPLLDEAESIYAPSSHPVFQLVPPLFETRAQALYLQMGQPPVSSNTFWAVYLRLLQAFRDVVSGIELAEMIAEYQEATQLTERDEISVLPGLRELRNGDRVIGQNVHDSQPAVVEYADFTDDEDEEDDSSDEDGTD